MIGDDGPHVPLPIDDLVDRSGPQTAVVGAGRFDVPTPRAEGAPDTNSVVRGKHPLGCQHRAGFDRKRDAVGDCLDQRERGRQLLVVRCVSGVNGNGPLGDRSARGQVVGNRRTDQAVAGEVLMSVDQAGHDDAVRSTEDHVRFEPDVRRFPGVDGDDAAIAHGDGAVGDDAAIRVHRDDGVAADQDVDRLEHLLTVGVPLGLPLGVPLALP